MDAAVVIVITLFSLLMVWLGISTYYEFRYQLPFLKVQEGYPEKKLRMARALLRFFLIGAQLAGWTFLLTIFYDYLETTFEWGYENGMRNIAAQDQLFLFKIAGYSFCITMWLTFSAISTAPSILWLPFKMVMGNTNHKESHQQEENDS
jgi:hypothetical protein